MTIWVLSDNRKVTKKNLCLVGASGFYATSFYEETPRLIEKYLIDGKFSKLLSALDSIHDNRNHYRKDLLTAEKVGKLIFIMEELQREMQELLEPKGER